MAHTHSMQASINGRAKPSSACHCDPQSTDTCCELVCFERPNYFCGHMLTDRDLMLEQRYVREKNKLYHRALDGHGIVCGLRITCHHDCPGEILVEEGFAIDNCGNDLVVCDTARFDAIQRLKDKGLLVEEPTPDTCKPEKPKPVCEVTQCFHVTICYKETETDFTTPFVAGCTTALTECEPTRMREDVWFDVVEELPEELDWMDKLERRIRSCFELLTHSQFGKKLQEKKGDLRLIASNNSREGLDCWKLFCELRSLFLLHLRKHPDKYNCMLEQEILHIPFPEENPNNTTSCNDAICELLKLSWQYVMACVMGEFVPQCQEPASAACIVLGTVEVKNGKIAKICNCPRTYVQLRDRAIEVLLASAFGEMACEYHGNEEATQEEELEYGEVPDPCKKTKRQHVCCSTYAFDCWCFIEHIIPDPCLPLRSVLKYLREIKGSNRRFAEVYDFTDSCAQTPKDLVTDFNRANSSSMRADLAMRETPVKIDLNEQYLTAVKQEFANVDGLLHRNKPIHVLTDPNGTAFAAYSPKGTEALLKAEIDQLRHDLEQLRHQMSPKTVPGQTGKGKLETKKE
jgi:predicted DNA binding CopG/RHH family protein